MDAKVIIMAILLFSILVEGTVEYLKLSFQKKMCAEIVGAFIFSLIITIGYKLDFFQAYLGLNPIVPYLGQVLTAVVMARGSNYMFDLWGKFTEGVEEIEKSLERDGDEPTIDHEVDEGVG